MNQFIPALLGRRNSGNTYLIIHRNKLWGQASILLGAAK